MIARALTLPSRLSKTRFALNCAVNLAKIAPVWSEAGLRNPVFVIGNGRSGTTLLNRLLALHPDTAVIPTEANHLWHPKSYPWDQAAGYKGPPYWEDPITFSRFSADLHTQGHADAPNMRAIFGAYQRFVGGAEVLVNKTVMVNFMLPLVADMFPGARFIVCRRDGRSVALSFAKKEVGKMKDRAMYLRRAPITRFDEVLDAQARLWVRSNEAISRFVDQAPPGRTHEIRYEELCSRPEPVLRSLAQFMGLQSAPLVEVAQLAESGRNSKVHSEMSPQQVSRIETIMESQLLELGYQREAVLGS